MNVNKFNIDLSQRIKAYHENILKENKYVDVVGNVNNLVQGGARKSKYIEPNGNVPPPNPFATTGTLEGGKKKINRTKKAEKWRDFSADTLGIGLDLGDKGLSIKDKHDPKMQAMKSAKDIFGGKKKKISRIKKAEKWRDFAGDTVNKALDLGDKGLTIKDKHDPKSQAQASITKALGGKLPSKARIKTAYAKLDAYSSGASKIKPTKLQIQVLEEAGILKPSSSGGGMPKTPCASKAKVTGGAKPPSAWILHLQKYYKEHGGSYKDAMKNAKASYKK
jgi:hypothetical protein